MAKLTHDALAVLDRRPNIFATLDAPAVRRIPLQDRTLYSLVDVLRQLVPTPDPLGYWKNLVRKEPILEDYVVDAPFEDTSGENEAALEPATDRLGMMRLFQSIPHPRAEAARRWLAALGTEKIEAQTYPETSISRARQEFHRRGRSLPWIDRRLQAMVARFEIVGEWHKRGVVNGEQYRELSNALFSSTFGMDVEAYKKANHLASGDNLRDHLSEVDLGLLAFAEKVAAELHRLENSNSFTDLLHDVQDAGTLAAQARKRMAKAAARPTIKLAQ